MSAVTPFLIIGHPGHELAVHHWLETARPRVIVLTDGSGLGGASRLQACRDCLAAAGAEPGGVFGPMSDRAWYAALLAGDAGPLVTCGRDVLAEAVERRPGLIVCDGREGRSPMHDLAFDIAQAVAEALTRRGRAVELRSVPVIGPIRPDEPVFELSLDGPATERKLAVARAYAGMRVEVDRRLAEPGFRPDRERFYRPEPEPASDWRPIYERIAEEGLAEGRYAEAITYARHVRPLARQLREALGERDLATVS
jgi:hypothetical protein